MKYLIVLAILLFSTACNDQAIKKNSKDEYRVINDNDAKGVWKLTPIKAEFDAWDYSNFYGRAINNPDKWIKVDSSKQLVKLKPIFKKIVSINRDLIIYHSKTKTISHKQTSGLLEPLEDSSFIILYILISIILIIATNILRLKIGNENWTSIILISISAIAVFTAVFALIFNDDIRCVIFLATFVAENMIFVNIDKEKIKAYIIFSLIYYVLMVAGIILLYI